MTAGRLLVVSGAVLMALGGLLLLAGRFLPWLGHLPGDLRYEGERFRLYLPWVSMLLASAVLTLLLNLVLWLIRR